ncbi:MAG TPA: hypothetical protein PKD54_01730, partial [Pirellulaceae bacterium]|nr:hypothetical protein [Pirellulaceae bacterium]
MNDSNHDEYLPEEEPATETPESPISSKPEWPNPPYFEWAPPRIGVWIDAEQGYSLPPREAVQIGGNSPEEKPPGGLFGWSEVFCWALIVGITGLIFLLTVWGQLNPDSTNSDASQKKGHLMQIQLNGKFLVFGNRTGNSDVLGAFNARDLIRQGSLMERYAGVILVAEVESPQSAFRLFGDIDADIRLYGYQPTEMEVRLRAILENILQRRTQAKVFDGRDVDPDDRQFLFQQLGWLGKVALTTASSPDLEARKEVEAAATVALVGVVVLGLGFIGMLLLGFGLLITGIVMAATGKMRGQLPNWSGNGLIYLETFTIWIMIFFGMQFSLQFVGMPQHQMISLLPLVFFGSLGVLIWPLMRGIGMGQMLSDLGLAGRRKIANAFLGIPSYFAIAPVVVVAAV